jgi:hypothetical protein
VDVAWDKRWDKADDVIYSFQGGFQAPVVGYFGYWGSMLNVSHHVDYYLGIPLNYELGEIVFFGYFLPFFQSMKLCNIVAIDA